MIIWWSSFNHILSNCWSYSHHSCVYVNHQLIISFSTVEHQLITCWLTIDHEVTIWRIKKQNKKHTNKQKTTKHILNIGWSIVDQHLNNYLFSVDHQLIISCSIVDHVVIIHVYLQKQNKQTNSHICWSVDVDMLTVNQQLIIDLSTAEHKLIISWSNVDNEVIIPVYLKNNKQTNKRTNISLILADQQLIIC